MHNCLLEINLCGDCKRTLLTVYPNANVFSINYTYVQPALRLLSIIIIIVCGINNDNNT